MLVAKPILQIEIENRHLYDNQTGIKDVRGIVSLVELLGYQTYFLIDRQLLKIEQIQWVEDKDKHFLVAMYNDRYIYNFIFMPEVEIVI